jgi:hypothetical protein
MATQIIVVTGISYMPIPHFAFLVDPQGPERYDASNDEGWSYTVRIHAEILNLKIWRSGQ